MLVRTGSPICTTARAYTHVTRARFEAPLCLHTSWQHFELVYNMPLPVPNPNPKPNPQPKPEPQPETETEPEPEPEPQPRGSCEKTKRPCRGGLRCSANQTRRANRGFAVLVLTYVHHIPHFSHLKIIGGRRENLAHKRRGSVVFFYVGGGHLIRISVHLICGALGAFINVP